MLEMYNTSPTTKERPARWRETWKSYRNQQKYIDGTWFGAILIKHVAPLFVDTVTLGFLLKSDTPFFHEVASRTNQYLTQTRFLKNWLWKIWETEEDLALVWPSPENDSAAWQKFHRHNSPRHIFRCRLQSYGYSVTVNTKPLTWQDEEDSGNEGQDGAMGPDVADVAEHEADEHKEEADQREGCGRTDHFWKQTGKADQLFWGQVKDIDTGPMVCCHHAPTLIIGTALTNITTLLL